MKTEKNLVYWKEMCIRSRQQAEAFPTPQNRNAYKHAQKRVADFEKSVFEPVNPFWRR